MLIVVEPGIRLELELVGRIITFDVYEPVGTGIYSSHANKSMTFLKDDALPLTDRAMWPTTIANKVGVGSLMISRGNGVVTLTINDWSGSLEVSIPEELWPSKVDSLT